MALNVAGGLAVSMQVELEGNNENDPKSFDNHERWRMVCAVTEKENPSQPQSQKERTMEKIFVLTIEEQDGLYLELYRSRENAVKFVLDDLHDRYHFDTDEPYISESELQEKRNTAVSELDKYGWWKDDEVTYCLDEKLVQD